MRSTKLINGKTIFNSVLCQNPRTGVPLMHLSFSVCSRYLVSADMDRSPLFSRTIWETKQIEEVKEDPQIHLWDAKTGVITAQFKMCEFATHVAVSKDGKFVAAVGESNTIYLWDTVLGEHLRIELPPDIQDLGVVNLGFAYNNNDLFVLEYKSQIDSWHTHLLEEKNNFNLIDYEQNPLPQIHWCIPETEVFQESISSPFEMSIDIQEKNIFPILDHLAKAKLVINDLDGNNIQEFEIFKWPVHHPIGGREGLVNLSPRSGILNSTGSMVAFVNNDTIVIKHLD